MSNKVNLFDYLALAFLTALIFLPDPLDLPTWGLPVLNVLSVMAYYYLRFRGRLWLIHAWTAEIEMVISAVYCVSLLISGIGVKIILETVWIDFSWSDFLCSMPFSVWFDFEGLLLCLHHCFEGLCGLRWRCTGLSCGYGCGMGASSLGLMESWERVGNEASKSLFSIGILDCATSILGVWCMVWVKGYPSRIIHSYLHICWGFTVIPEKKALTWIGKQKSMRLLMC